MLKISYLIAIVLFTLLFSGCKSPTQPKVNTQTKKVTLKVHNALVSYRNDFGSLQRKVYTEFVPIYENKDKKREVRIDNLSDGVKNATILGLASLNYDVKESKEDFSVDYEVIPYLEDVYLTDRSEFTYGLIVLKNNKIIANISQHIDERMIISDSFFFGGDINSIKEENFLHDIMIWNKYTMMKFINVFSLHPLYVENKFNFSNNLKNILKQRG